MFTQAFGSPPSEHFLSSFHKSQWTSKRVSTLTLQLASLFALLYFICAALISYGENRLQQEWNTQQFKELQTIALLLTDKVNFQGFKAEALSQSESLRQFIATPTEINKNKLLTLWKKLENNIPELVGVSFHDTKGELKLTSNQDLLSFPLPTSAIKNQQENDVIHKIGTPKNNLVPLTHQSVKIENQQQQKLGYLSTYHSLAKNLENINTALSDHNSSLIILDLNGVIGGGINKNNSPLKLANSWGENLNQIYPKLWQKMTSSSFGQYQDKNASFVYLKIELTSPTLLKQNYYLLSYINTKYITVKFNHWKQMLIVFTLFIALLFSLIFYLSHRFAIEKHQKNISLSFSQAFFNTNNAWLVANKHGRIFATNKQAEIILSQAQETLTGKTFKSIFKQQNKTYNEAIFELNNKGKWTSEITYAQSDEKQLKVEMINVQTQGESNKNILIKIESISEIIKLKNQQKLESKLIETDVATVLIDTNGKPLIFNKAFENQFIALLNNNNLPFLFTEQTRDWQQILNQLKNSGKYKTIVENSETQQRLLVSLIAHYNNEAEINFITCTLFDNPFSFCDDKPKLPNRSTILSNIENLNFYFTSLNKKARSNASLLLININPKTIISPVSHNGDLQTRQRKIETQLLRLTPFENQISRWVLGKLVLIMPNTSANHAYLFATEIIQFLNKHNLVEGVSIGISHYANEISLEKFISNAEIALERSTKGNGLPIHMAYTHDLPYETNDYS